MSVQIGSLTSASRPGPLLRDCWHALRHPSSLGTRAMKASMWTVLGFGVQYPLRLAGNLVMTHLLAPNDFGLMALVLTLHVGLSLLSDMGIGQSIMRDPRGGTPRFLRTAWAVQILRGAGIALALLAIAGAVHVLGPQLAAPSTVYADPRLGGLIAASALVFVVSGTQSTNLFRAVRRMEAKRHTGVELLAQAATFAVMIGLGWVLQSVWALLWGAVAGAVAKTVLSHVLLPGPVMRWRWDRAQARAMWRFGKWLIGASLGGFLIAQGDRLVLAGLVDAHALGVLAIAGLWVEAGRQVLLKISQFVFVPMFSEVLNTRPDDIGPVLRKAFRYFSLTCLAGSVVTAGVAMIAVTQLYDARYAEAAGMIAVLSMRGVLLRYAVIDQFLLSTGDTRYIAAAKLACGMTALIGVYLVQSWFGLIWAVAFAGMSSAPLAASLFAHRSVRAHIDWRQEAALLSSTLGLGLVLAWFVAGA